jgi:hypothetical protein
MLKILRFLRTFSQLIDLQSIATVFCLRTFWRDSLKNLCNLLTFNQLQVRNFSAAEFAVFADFGFYAVRSLADFCGKAFKYLCIKIVVAEVCGNLRKIEVSRIIIIN